MAPHKPNAASCCASLAAGRQAISQKDDAIRGAEEAIQKVVEAKGKTAQAYADIVKKCAKNNARHSYHL